MSPHPLTPHPPKGWRLLVIAVLLLGFGLRFHLLDAQSFWNDEGNSARLSERSLELIIEGTASDIHPPLYYLLLHGWRALAGDSEFALRAFSAFAGVLAVPAVMALGLLLGGKRPYPVALIAGLVTAVSPPLITYSQETRMYALLSLLAVLSTLFLAKWVLAVFSFQYSVFSRQAIGWGAAYVLCAAAGLYTHYFFPAVLLAQNFIFLLILLKFTIHNSQFTIRNSRLRTGGEMVRNNVVASAHDHTAPSRPYPPFPHPSSPHPATLVTSFIALQLAILLLYLPWLPIFLQQFGADDLSGRGALLPFLREAVWWLAFGQTLPFVWWGLALVLLAVLFGLVNGRTHALPPFIFLIAPILMMYAAGTTGPEFFKFLVVAAPFLALLLGMGFSPQRRRERRGNSTKRNLRALRASAVYFLPLLLLLLTLPFLWQSLDNLYHNPAYARADYRGMAQRILDEGHTNAAVILDAPNQWEVFTYYFPDESAVYPLPKGRSRPDPAEIDAALSEIAGRYGRIYAIFWGEAQRDPERLVERWLDENAFKAVDEWVGDVRFVMYAVPAAPAGTMETETNWQFGDAITLQGYTVGVEAALPGDVIPVTLFWQTAVPLDKRYKIFLHLLDGNGRPAAQRDSEPGGGLALTTTWPPGETIVDNHGLFLPLDLPPGRYTLTLGLYDIADPAARLPIQTEMGAVDAVDLAVIEVAGD